MAQRTTPSRMTNKPKSICLSPFLVMRQVLYDRRALFLAAGTGRAAGAVRRPALEEALAISSIVRFERAERGISAVMSRSEAYASRCLMSSQAGRVDDAG